ncbi:hypothetical protein DHB64_05710 [Antarcticibacterium sp. W02-3]|nr:hypothetical protein [Antarcticibacterium sp. W02-3]
MVFQRWSGVELCSEVTAGESNFEWEFRQSGLVSEIFSGSEALRFFCGKAKREEEIPAICPRSLDEALFLKWSEAEWREMC